MRNTFVGDPVLLDFVEILVVEGSLQFLWLFVVESADAVKEVVLDESLIGYLPRLVVQLPPSVHHIVLPLTLVTAPVLVRVLAPTLAFASSLESFVLTSVHELVHRIYRLFRVKL